MKSFAVAAALAFLPASPLFAQIAAAASGPDHSEKSKLLDEIESWRATKLPHVTPPSPLTARFEPRLDEIKAAALDASVDAALARPRGDFEAWKKDLLRRMYDDAKAAGLTRETYSAYSDEEKTQALFSAALHAQLARFAGVQALGGEQQASLRDFSINGSERFDGGTSRSAGPGAVAAPPALAANDPARYAKVRQILISQGAKARVVDLAIQEAMRQNADPLLVLAVIKQESRFRTHVTSRVGARGLMQIMPGTGRGLGVRDSNLLYDAQTNLRAGIRFMKSLWGQFVGGDMSALAGMSTPSAHVRSAVAAYNAGAGAVRKYSGVPPYRETQGYVKRVLAYYDEFKQSMSA
jgi:soluble lytic murein transglycosylase-like protein